MSVQSLEMEQEQEGLPQLRLAQSVFQMLLPLQPAPPHPVSHGPRMLWCLGLFQSLEHVLIKAF